MRTRIWLSAVVLVAGVMVSLALWSPTGAAGYRAEQARASLAPAGFQQTGAFLYQGRLQKNGAPVNGVCDASFYLYGAANGGFVISSVFSPSLQVGNGLFNVVMDFGPNVFTGEQRWVETEVGCGGDTPVVLTPRTPLLPAPYAYALPGFRTYFGNPDLSGRATVNVVGGIISDTTGNGITADSYDSVIGGGDFNSVGGASTYSHIGGGKFNNINFTSVYAAIGGGYSNDIVNAVYGTIGGGDSNQIQGSSSNAVIAGGVDNRVEGDSINSAIGGGGSNRVEDNSDYGAIAGGQSNVITGTAYNGMIGGGLGNRLEGSHHGTIGGGQNNRLSNAVWSAAGGGRDNLISGVDYATIGGGVGNVITGAADYAAIPGGSEAQARDFGQMAFASGGFASKPGSAQYSVYVLRGTTGLSTAFVELFADGAIRRISVVPHGAMSFYVQVVGYTADEWVGAWEFRGVIKNTGGAVVQPGCGTAVCIPTTPLKTVLQAMVAGEDAKVEADNTNSALTVKVKGNTVQPMRWVATVQLTEVAW